MGSPDSAVLREDAHDLLLGHLPPEYFAQRVVPAPHTLRTSHARQVLGSIYSFLVVVTLVSFAAVPLLAVTGHTLHDSIIGIAGLSLVALSMARSIRSITIDSRHFRLAVVSPKIDDKYRESCHAEFLTQLEHEVQDGVVPVDSESIHSVVKGIQQALSLVGVPNVQVCILRIEDTGAYVSYYAGYDEPTIAQGTVIYDFSVIGARRVLYRLSCPLEVEPDNHELAIVATCSKLSDTDRKFVKEAAALLSRACTRPQSSEPVCPGAPPA